MTAEQLQIYYAGAGVVKTLSQSVKKAARSKWEEAHQIWEKYGAEP